MKNWTKPALGAALALTCVAVTGCKSNPEDVSYRAISRNLTPELQSTHERPIDVSRNLAVNNNTNWRLFWDDMGRVFHTDNHSRLAPSPTVYTSGNPR